VLGRHRKALASLSLLFKHRRIGKTYWAVVDGGPQDDEGTIDMPLGRLDPQFGWWMKPDPDGQPAVTKWKVLGRSQSARHAALTAAGTGEVDPPQAGRVKPENESPAGLGAAPLPPGESHAHPEGNLTWLALEPVTGRTHQLRVHCAALGFPIFGDDIYGNEASQRRARQIRFVPRADAPGLQLHAREIVVPISKNKEPVRVVAPVPAHMRARLTACGWNGD
jgi:tRNA pseudouridine32 synthase/23S rRNA pseudouridine746 synthase